MKKVIIIDDEPLARSIVKNYIGKFSELTVVAECENGFEGFKSIQALQPDLVILDVQMPKISGFEMLELIDRPPAIIFATAFDEFAIKAFENNAVDYLLKPFSEERFRDAIQKWQTRPNNTVSTAFLKESIRPGQELPHVVVRSQGEINIVALQDILYIEAFDDYVKLFTADTFYLKKQTMAWYESHLDATKFFRVHRSFIIQLKELIRIEPMEKNTWIAILRNGSRIPVSRSAYSVLREKLGI
jgi:two-component system, LytTR family, response regulator